MDTRFCRKVHGSWLHNMESQQKNLISCREEQKPTKYKVIFEDAICRDSLLEDRPTLQEWMKDLKFNDKVLQLCIYQKRLLLQSLEYRREVLVILQPVIGSDARL